MADAAGESASAAALPPATNRGGWLRAWSIPKFSTSSDLSLKMFALLNRRRRFCLVVCRHEFDKFCQGEWHQHLFWRQTPRPTSPPMASVWHH